MKTILTGIRPTGKLHVGHYFGAITNWIKLQDSHDTYIEIADVQALTDNFENPSNINKNVYELVLDLLAVGIDPIKSTIFIQSQIKEIAELTVYFSNLVTISRLQRNPTIKTEISQKKYLFGPDGEGVTYGFLGYPVSQAADIAIFNGDVVPVGEDQLPLLEQAREIIRKFNKIYGNTFNEPEEYMSKTRRIKGLDGNDKMGKSLNNAIYLTDNNDELTNKIMNALTDPNKIKKDDKANPEVCMVYQYHQLVNKDYPKVCEECKQGLRGCVECKRELINHMNEFLKPIQTKRAYYEAHPETVNDIILNGTKKAQERAKKTMDIVNKNMYLDYFKED